MFSDFTSFLTIFFHNASIVRTGSGRLESCSVNPSTHVLGFGVLNKGSNQFFYKVVSYALGCFMQGSPVGCLLNVKQFKMPGISLIMSTRNR